MVKENPFDSVDFNDYEKVIETQARIMHEQRVDVEYGRLLQIKLKECYMTNSINVNVYDNCKGLIEEYMNHVDKLRVTGYKKLQRIPGNA